MFFQVERTFERTGKFSRATLFFQNHTPKLYCFDGTAGVKQELLSWLDRRHLCRHLGRTFPAKHFAESMESISISVGMERQNHLHGMPF
jgi:hypothetical protein